MSRNTTAYVIALLLAGMGTGYGIARLARTPAPEKAGPVLPEAMHSAQESLHDERTSDLKREKEILSDRVSELVDENNVLRASVEQLRSELAGALASAAAAKRTPTPRNLSTDKERNRRRRNQACARPRRVRQEWKDVECLRERCEPVPG